MSIATRYSSSTTKTRFWEIGDGTVIIDAPAFHPCRAAALSSTASPSRQAHIESRRHANTAAPPDELAPEAPMRWPGHFPTFPSGLQTNRGGGSERLSRHRTTKHEDLRQCCSPCFCAPNVNGRRFQA